MAAELEFKVVLDPNLGNAVGDVVAFGRTFEATRVYAEDDVLSFYLDLAMGRPMPLTLVARDLSTLSVVVAAAVFLNRTLAIRPEMLGVVTGANLVDATGVAGLAHLDRDLARFFRFLARHTALAKNLPEKEASLKQAIRWIEEYAFEGRLPSLPPEKEPPRIVDRGTDGFVVATIDHDDLMLGWEELYRFGFLRGLLMTRHGEDRWKILGARKSRYLSLDFHRAANILNEAEAAMGEPLGWVGEEKWLRCPLNGTLILPSAIINVLLRV